MTYTYATNFYGNTKILMKYKYINVNEPLLLLLPLPLLLLFRAYLGPVCLSSGFKHRNLVAYCATLNYHSAQIQYPCVSYKETEVLN